MPKEEAGTQRFGWACARTWRRVCNGGAERSLPLAQCTGGESEEAMAWWLDGRDKRAQDSWLDASTARLSSSSGNLTPPRESPANPRVALPALDLEPGARLRPAKCWHPLHRAFT